MKRISKKWLSFFSLFFLVIITLVVFHQSLICYGVKLFLTSRLPEGEALLVNYERGGWENGSFVLHQMHLSRKGGETSIGFEIKVEKVRFAISLQIFPFCLTSQTIFDSPDIVLLGHGKNQQKRKRELYAQCEKYLFKKKVIINHGKVAFDQSGSSETYFSIQTNRGEKKEGELYLAQSKDGLKKAPLIAHFSQVEKEITFHLHFDQIDLAWLFSSVQSVSHSIDPAICLSSGTLSGHVTFGLRVENQISQIAYECDLSDFALNHFRYGMLLRVREVSWKKHLSASGQSTKFVREIDPSFTSPFILSKSRLALWQCSRFREDKMRQKSGRNFAHEPCRLTTSGQSQKFVGEIDPSFTPLLSSLNLALSYGQCSRFREDKMRQKSGRNFAHEPCRLTTSQEIKQRLSPPYFEKIWPYFIGEGEFFGAKITFKDPLSNKHQGTVELRGKLQLTIGDQPLIDLHGLFLKEGREYPLRIIGQGLMKDCGNWKIAVDLSLHREGGKKMTSYLSLASQGPKTYRFESCFENLSLDPADLIQALIQMKYPQIAPFKMEKGSLSGRLSGWIDERRLHRLEVKELQMENVLFSDQNRRGYFSASKLMGSGEFDFSTPDFFDGTFWDLEILKGDMTGIEKIEVSDLKAKLSMHDQYVKPSVVSGTFNGIEGNISLEGLYTHLQLHLNGLFSPDDLFLLIDHNRKNPSSVKDKISLQGDIHLKMTRRQLATDGVLQVGGETKERGDEISFGAKWDLKELLNRGFLKNFSLGWFKADRLSSRIYNLPLEFFGKSWRGEGTIGIEGTLNNERMVLSLDPTHARYLSPSIILEAGYGEEKAATCNFSYVFEKNHWSGKIPLKKARLIEQSFGIEFNSFSSEIDLEGSVFHFQNVIAETNGIHFEGTMSLDYQYKDCAELFISSDKIQGSTRAIQQFLRHFNAFASLDLPLTGELDSGKGGMTLSAFVGGREEMRDWNVQMTLREGFYKVSPTCHFEKLSTQIEWSWKDRVLRLSHNDGYLCLNGFQTPKLYRLNVPVAHVDLKRGEWSYDVRLEAPTHDICRFVGKAKSDWKKEEIQILIDSKLTHFFGAKATFREIVLDLNGKLRRIDFETELSSRDLSHHLNALAHAGLFSLKGTILEKIQSPPFKGSAALKAFFCRESNTFSLDIQSDHLTFGLIDLEDLLIHAERRGNQFKLDQFQSGAFSMYAHMVRELETWRVSAFNLDWKHCKLRGNEGVFHPKKGKGRLPLNHLEIDLAELLQVIPHFSTADLSYVKGLLSSRGEIELNLSNGFKQWELSAHLEMRGKEFSKGDLLVESEGPLHIYFSPEEGFELSQANFSFSHPQSNQLWGKCHLNSLSCTHEMKTWKGKGAMVVLPPEMLSHLGATHAIPCLSAQEGEISLFQTPFKWDNQIELSFDFSFGKEAEIRGQLKEGYYWIRDKSWYLNDCCYDWKRGEGLNFKLNTVFDHHPFDIHAQIHFPPHFKSSVTIRETEGNGEGLTIISYWNNYKGFFIQSMEGAVCGLDFSFHHHPRGSFLDQMVLTGQLKIDMPTFAKYLPSDIQKSIQPFEIGDGYEISGDCILSKEKPLNSHFTGHLKGKQFELMGSEMETLLSEITIHPGHIHLSHFNMSDASGIFAIDEIQIVKTEKENWKVTIPRIVAQDFRPSLLKKIGRYRGPIKPMTIRDMHFENIQGELGDAKSFTGRGRLNFTNTFKRDYNIFDIPFEILGRLGLDMGLLVPIRGHLDYVIVDGKIVFTNLSDSYSEGKRSKFYLSPVEDSYIDFDGTVNINIKMKQYVLLKITEPFTLSIGGTFENIHYSLK